MSDFFEIEKGIPVPARQLKYPLREMEIGDSFFVPSRSDGRPPTIYKSLGTYHRTLAPKRFVQRLVEGGARIWRIA